LGVFAEAAPDYIEHGLPCFPVTTDKDKRPLVRNWQVMGQRAARNLLTRPEFADANLGICCGKKTGITEVDVDESSDAAVADAMSRFGPTSVIIRTASGKYKLWYRHNGENRITGGVIDGHRIDILGRGQTVAPPSIRPDLFSRRYEFIEGGLDDIANLQVIDPAGLPNHHKVSEREPTLGPGGLVPVGQRDDWLFRKLLRDVRDVDSEADLRDIAFSYNEGSFAEPLPETQVEAKVQRVLYLERIEQNFARRPSVIIPHDIGDQLTPDELWLMYVLRRSHPNGRKFKLATRSMGQTYGVDYRRIQKAADGLVRAGVLECVNPPVRRFAGEYRLL
jgi:hypothetical protein